MSCNIAQSLVRLGGGGGVYGDENLCSSTRQQPDTQQSGLLLSEPSAGSAVGSADCGLTHERRTKSLEPPEPMSGGAAGR